MTHLAKARAHAQAVLALIEAATLARAKGAQREELRCVGSAQIQLRACRIAVDTVAYEIEHNPSPTRTGGGDSHGGDAA